MGFPELTDIRSHIAGGYRLGFSLFLFVLLISLPLQFAAYLAEIQPLEVFQQPLHSVQLHDLRFGLDVV